LRRADFLAKIEWEGGIQAALAAGLSPSDCDDDDLMTDWVVLCDWWKNRPDSYDRINDAIDLLGPEEDSEEDLLS